MAIVGIDTLIYHVEDVIVSARFFKDFGLECVEQTAERAHFVLPEGSSVLLKTSQEGPPAGSRVQGSGVQEIIWGVDTAEALERLANTLASDCDVRRDRSGSAYFLTDFGISMGLRVFTKRAVICAPDPINAPGHVRRLNQHRKWRLRARPKTIAHVVFSVPGYEAAAEFMQSRLNFRLSDSQRGFGKYLRADGSMNHHNLLLLNACAPLPDMDGTLKFHHANFGVEDIDEIMVGANHMQRQGWSPSHYGLGRHRVDSALFFYIPCPAGGEAEYGADSDCLDDSWVPRDWVDPLFAFSHFVHDLPPFLMKEPQWHVNYLIDKEAPTTEAGGP
jgi:hypothetical protein